MTGEHEQRVKIVEYMERQLIGPAGGLHETIMSDTPITRYLMGTLYPQDAGIASTYEDEDEGNPASDADEVDDSPLSMAFQRLPASLGISFYLHDCDVLNVEVWGARYEKLVFSAYENHPEVFNKAAIEEMEASGLIEVCENLPEAFCADIEAAVTQARPKDEETVTVMRQAHLRLMVAACIGSGGVPEEITSLDELLQPGRLESGIDWFSSQHGERYMGYLRDAIRTIVPLAVSAGVTKDRIKKIKARIDWPDWRRRPIAELDAPQLLRIQKDLTQPVVVDVLEETGQIHVVWRPMGGGSLVTVTLMNSAEQDPDKRVDPRMCLFQVGIRCCPENGVIHEYPTINRLSYDQEEEELALQYKGNITYAVGHGCAASWEQGSVPDFVEAVHMPRVEVKPVTTTLEGADEKNIPEVLRLQYLSNPDVNADELVGKLEEFVSGYREWFSEIVDVQIDGHYEAARDRITARIAAVLARIGGGIELLARDPLVRRTFALANRAMLMQMVHTGDEMSGSVKKRNEKPFQRPDYDAEENAGIAWRPFQLAYQLLVLESLVNEDSDERNTVDLLWFPTGGGKTEAYLALAAFEMLYRRLRYGDAGAGTAVIKRYTLRLLTTQQFQRASTLICALELLRKENINDLGMFPFTLGLWVGQSSSPNKFTSDSDYEKGAYEFYKEMLEADEPENAFQLLQCPWCGTKIVPEKRTDNSQDYGVRATQTSFEFYCPSDDCDMHDRIPVTVVDEDMYSNSPTFVIGTVDKFARLAWDHRAARMFGSVDGSCRPPSLIIQDELHLISGPLGTIAGIYEAAIDTLIKSRGAAPKIIAATATIRRSADQVERLYGRSVRIFPPPGISADDSYYARVDHDSYGRLYIGVMGNGHTPITSLVHTAAVLSQSVLDNTLNDNAVDTWWTQVIYHNSRRELGKTMTLARDDIPARAKAISKDDSNVRELNNVEQLSANVQGSHIPNILENLKVAYPNPGVIDILPCTNMISVGVDIGRLGLMLVNGQPKTTAEYIQASSRVGRSSGHPPGIVVTLYSGTKPRDRSHYENFVAYHGALYRSVEPTSVTPYAPPARLRALHAALIILMRHAGGLGRNEDAGLFDPTNPKTQELITQMRDRMVCAERAEKDDIEHDLDRLIREWLDAISEARTEQRPLRYYNKGSGQFSSLMRPFDGTSGEGWPTLNSMRHVDRESLIKVTGED